MKYVLEIAYNGTQYHGWQIQKNAHTVQAELNKTLSTLLGSEIETTGSGRTDTGVHAEQQFVQFETTEPIDNPQKFLFQANAILPKDIYIRHLYTAKEDFSVRHDAISRSYEYRISRRKNPFLQNLCCFYFHRELNVSLMQQAADILLKHKDFQSFSKYHTDVDHFECTIHRALWEETDDLLIFHITANRFLRGMVRAIVGTLLETGLGRISIVDFEKIILARDRKAAKHAVPPEGLFLTKILYREGAIRLIM